MWVWRVVEDLRDGVVVEVLARLYYRNPSNVAIVGDTWEVKCMVWFPLSNTAF